MLLLNIMKAINFIIQQVKEAGSQSAIARKIGISQPTINRICQGDAATLSMDTVKKLARAYNRPLSYFLDDTEQGQTVSEPSVAYNVRAAGLTVPPQPDPNIKPIITAINLQLVNMTDVQLAEIFSRCTDMLAEQAKEYR